jgi:hypothetical protein
LKTIFLLILAFALSPWAGWAQTAASAPKKISPPLFLKPTDKTPSKALTSPAVPDKGRDGSPLDADKAITEPPAGIMARLSDPELFEALKGDKKKETRIKQVYWHAAGDWGYCHVKDVEGNHWYGWSDGKNFQWVLFRGNHYWWHDDFAGHWLYYGGGCWCRAGLQTPDQLQVVIDGEYYLCQKDGMILKDMGQDGKGAILSGNGPFRGDFHHEGHQGHGGAKPAQGSNASPDNGTAGSPPSH